MKPLCLFPLSVLFAATSHAATISISRSAKLAEDLSFDIDNYGEKDWALWQKNAGTTSSNATPSNEKSGATLISSMSLVGTGSSFTASTNAAPNWDFSYTGGLKAPTSGISTDVNGVFNGTLKTQGNGVGLTITLPTTGTYNIYLWAAGFSLSNGQLTATLANAPNAVSTGLTDDAATLKDMYLYTLTVQANAVNDVVSLSLINNDASPNNSSHVIISAAAIQLVPEPSTLLLYALGALALLRRRR